MAVAVAVYFVIPWLYKWTVDIVCAIEHKPPAYRWTFCTLTWKLRGEIWRFNSRLNGIIHVLLPIQCPNIVPFQPTNYAWYCMSPFCTLIVIIYILSSYLSPFLLFAHCFFVTKMFIGLPLLQSAFVLRRHSFIYLLGYMIDFISVHFKLTNSNYIRSHCVAYNNRTVSPYRMCFELKTLCRTQQAQKKNQNTQNNTIKYTLMNVFSWLSSICSMRYICGVSWLYGCKHSDRATITSMVFVVQIHWKVIICIVYICFVHICKPLTIGSQSPVILSSIIWFTWVCVCVCVFLFREKKKQFNLVWIYQK